jgi:hypothetical protein
MPFTNAERQRRRRDKLVAQARAGGDAAAEASAVAELRAALATRDGTLARLSAALATRDDALSRAVAALRTVPAIVDEATRARSIKLAERSIKAAVSIESAT